MKEILFRLARISVVIVFIFIICHSLKILPSSLEILGYPPEVGQIIYIKQLIFTPQLIPGVLPVSHLLLTINCSVNFLIYYLGGMFTPYFSFILLFLLSASGSALSRLIPIASFRSFQRRTRGGDTGRGASSPSTMTSTLSSQVSSWAVSVGWE